MLPYAAIVASQAAFVESVFLIGLVQWMTLNVYKNKGGVVKNIPLLIQYAQRVSSGYVAARDHVTLEEDLPAVVARNTFGVLSYLSTRLTEVSQETTDDS